MVMINVKCLDYSLTFDGGKQIVETWQIDTKAWIANSHERNALYLEI